MTIRQSYISVVAKANLTTYEQRLLIKAVEYGQRRIEGISLSHEHGVLEHHFNLVELPIVIRDVLSDGSQNYSHVLTAARKLCKRSFTYINASGDEVTTSWVLRVTNVRKSGELLLLLDKSFFDALYNYRKGFCVYDLQRALQLKHPQSIRLYQLVNNMQMSGCTYRIEALKEIFGVADKYARPNDFVRKFIDVAQRELAAQPSGNYFEYNVVRDDRGRLAAIHFQPVRRASDLEKEAAPSGIRQWCKDEYLRILIQHGGFTLRQLNSNKPTIDKLQQCPLGMPLLLQVIERARRKRPANMQGYIINAIKAELGLARSRK